MAAAHRSGKARWWTAANLLTLSRLILAPFAFREISRGSSGRALVILIAAGSTDFLDGFFARRMSDETRSGQFLDPVADKVLLSSVYAALARSGAIPRPFVALVFGRDLFLLASSIAAVLFTEYRDLKPTAAGKTSTFFQIGTAAVIVLADAAESGRARSIARWLLLPTALLTAGSGLEYAWRGWRHFAPRWFAAPIRADFPRHYLPR